MPENNHRRLLLFDIDGTLISTGGRAREMMVGATEEIFQRNIRFNFKDFAGSTDRKIVRTLILKNRLLTDNIDKAIERILSRYLELLKDGFAASGVVKPLPGVEYLLEQISNDPRFALGLVTGNIEAGARAKLQPVNLNRFFPAGAFGNDAVDRNLLPPIAIQRAQQYYRETFYPGDTWIIGDTPRDIECARFNRLRSMAVGTGGWTSADLEAHQPDLIFNNLSDSAAVIRALC